MITNTKNYTKKTNRNNLRKNGKKETCTDKITQRSIHRLTNGKKKCRVTIRGNWGLGKNVVGVWDSQKNTNI